MKGFLAAVHMLANGLAYIQPLSATDPGFGGGRPGGVDPDFGFGTLPHPGHGLPGYGHPDQGLPGYGHPDQGLPGYGHPDQGLPGQGGRPGNALPIAPVRPTHPIVLPPITTWPPQIPSLPDNSLPPSYGGRPEQPIVIPPDPSIGIDQPIYLPQLPAGSALIIALTGANVPQPKEAGVPPNAKPAILYQGAGTKPVLVYVTAAATPK